MRRQLAKSSIPARKAATPVTVISRMAEKLHFHGCAKCRRTIGCSCGTPLVNPVCRPCRGLELSRYDLAREPRDCCWDACELITRPDLIETYDLAGPGPWYRCPTCARQHASPPRKNPLTVSRESS